MDSLKVVITDYWYENLDMEKAELAKLPNVELCEYQCKDEEKLKTLVRDADAVITQFAPITRAVIESMEKCRLIVRYAIGVDNICIEAATEKGICVANVPDYGVDEVSNHAIALMLALAKKLFPLDKSVRQGGWDYTLVKPLWRIQGRTLGLVGFGRIPQLVAKKMAAFGVKIIAFDPYVNPETAKELGVELVTLDELMSKSDYVSVHCPLNDHTRHMIDWEKICLMKPEAILVNTARGAVIDEAALIRALQEKRISAAGMDVLEHEPIDRNSPLISMDNVILTPHNAWYSEEAVKTLQRMVGEEVVRVLSGNRPKNLINPQALK